MGSEFSQHSGPLVFLCVFNFVMDNFLPIFHSWLSRFIPIVEISTIKSIWPWALKSKIPKPDRVGIIRNLSLSQGFIKTLSWRYFGVLMAEQRSFRVDMCTMGKIQGSLADFSSPHKKTIFSSIINNDKGKKIYCSFKNFTQHNATGTGLAKFTHRSNILPPRLGVPVLRFYR